MAVGAGVAVGVSVAVDVAVAEGRITAGSVASPDASVVDKIVGAIVGATARCSRAPGAKNKKYALAANANPSSPINTMMRRFLRFFFCSSSSSGFSCLLFGFSVFFDSALAPGLTAGVCKLAN